MYIWMGFSVALLAVIVALCWRMLGFRINIRVAAVSVLLAVTSTFLEPVRSTLFFGQINLVLMALVLWDTSRGEPQGSQLTIAASVGVSWAVLQKDSWQYWTQTFFDSTRIADEGRAANQSMCGAITRIIDEPAPTWLWLLLSGIGVAMSMWVVVQRQRGGRLCSPSLSWASPLRRSHLSRGVITGCGSSP